MYMFLYPTKGQPGTGEKAQQIQALDAKSGFNPHSRCKLSSDLPLVRKINKQINTGPQKPSMNLFLKVGPGGRAK